jgi:hypothetical protein
MNVGNVVIVGPTQIDLVLCGALFCKVVTIVMVQFKDDLYHNQCPTNKFFPLIIQVFECLHY